MNGYNLAKILILIGLTIALIGLIVLALMKLNIPIGKLPGDLSIKKETWKIYFPIVSSIVISIIITVLINLFLYFFRK